MGRIKYSEEERRKMMTSFIRVTREIIDVEGIEKVSIRKIASLTGYNSATIYLYFSNVDELINLSSMSYLEKYCRALAADMPLMTSAMDAYIHTWELFCNHAFSQPHIFHHLFFTHHKTPLEETIDTYYTLYPQQLSNISGPIYEMLKGGTLEARCKVIIDPLVEEGLIKAEHAELINTMTICYFRQLLEERCNATDSSILAAQLTKKFMEALKLLLKIK